jgi:hypothetical protein
MTDYCSSTLWYFSTVPEFGDGWFAAWNKLTKKSSLSYIGSIPIGFYQLGADWIIDVKESSGGVYLVVFDSTGNDTNKVKTRDILLTSTRGDINNKLLYTKRTGSVLDIYMYALIAKEVTHITYYFNGGISVPPVPCFDDFSLDINDAVQQWCDGTTQITIKHNGTGDITTTYDLNSLSCGYIDQSGASPPLTDIKITETIGIDYYECNLRNPVFFVWKNTLGGWDSCLFDGTQTESIDTSSVGNFVKDYIRIGDTTNPETEIGKTARGRTVYSRDQLTKQQKIALTEIFYTNKIYIVNKGGSVNREIKILPGSFLIQETKEELHTISFEAQQPSINTIRN